MLTRLQRRNVILDPSVDPGVLGGRFYEDESGGIVTYRVKRLPVAIAASFVAGNVSSLLGIGGGIIKVPVLNAWCGVPLRAAAATSAFMIGVTATAGRDDLLRAAGSSSRRWRRRRSSACSSGRGAACVSARPRRRSG